MKIKFLLISLLMFLILLPNISAINYFEEAKTIVSQITSSMAGILTPIAELVIGKTADDKFLFAKILILILLFVILNTVIKKMKFIEDAKISGIIAIIVSILAVRFIGNSDLFLGILLPYGVLGVAIATILPFILFFYFIHVTELGSFGRKMAWIFFAIVFIGLWASRELSSTSNNIYIWTIVAMVIVFIFDKSIHKYFGLNKMNKFLKKADIIRIANLQADYGRYINVDSPQADQRRKDIKKQLEKLGVGID